MEEQTRFIIGNEYGTGIWIDEGMGEGCPGEGSFCRVEQETRSLRRVPDSRGYKWVNRGRDRGTLRRRQIFRHDRPFSLSSGDDRDDHGEKSVHSENREGSLVFNTVISPFSFKIFEIS